MESLDPIELINHSTHWTEVVGDEDGLTFFWKKNISPKIYIQCFQRIYLVYYDFFLILHFPENSDIAQRVEKKHEHL